VDFFVLVQALKGYISNCDIYINRMEQISDKNKIHGGSIYAKDYQGLYQVRDVDGWGADNSIG